MILQKVILIMATRQGRPLKTCPMIGLARFVELRNRPSTLWTKGRVV